MITKEDIDKIEKLLGTQDNGYRTVAVDMVEKAHGAQALTDSLNPAGLSRPHQNGWPVPWSAGIGPALGLWANIDPKRTEQADAERLCIVCGTSLGEDYVFANFHNEIYDHKPDPFERIVLNAPPSPTFVHPRCLLLAAAFCPFLKKQDSPGLTKTGEPLTRDDLRKLIDIHHKGRNNDEN